MVRCSCMCMRSAASHSRDACDVEGEDGRREEAQSLNFEWLSQSLQLS